jgi:hypothetical protein
MSRPMFLPSNLAHKAYLFCFAKHVQKKRELFELEYYIPELTPFDADCIASTTELFCLEANIKPLTEFANRIMFDKCRDPWKRLVIQSICEDFASYPEDWEDLYFFLK